MTGYAAGLPEGLVYPGGTTRELAYDALGRPRAIEVRDPGGNLLLREAYGRTPAGLVTARETERGPHAYTYDPNARLSSATGPVLPGEAYTYDRSGNRLTAADVAGAWVYDADDRLLETPLLRLSYDASGRTVRRVSAGRELRFAYGPAGRLSRVMSGNGTEVARYGYDPFGRRVWKEVSGRRVFFF
ncbi:hypothetical protein HCU62_03410, partial [Dissulfurirhabdus thermomarina]|nr:hypothetical protein [Dissulfurirhabdus thermomarina]